MIPQLIGTQLIKQSQQLIKILKICMNKEAHNWDLVIKTNKQQNNNNPKTKNLLHIHKMNFLYILYFEVLGNDNFRKYIKFC